MIKFNVFSNGQLFVNNDLIFFIQSNQNKILFVFHGLYGRARNWQSMAKKLTLDGSIIVISVDLRNHGENLFKEDHSYSLMMDDLIELFNYLNIKKTNLLGHSMGGKLAMLLSLHYPEFVNKLIVADIAPIDYQDDEGEIINSLLDLDLNLIQSRNDADKILSIKIIDKSLRMFLLQNLQLVNGRYEWGVNLKAIKKSMDNLKSFPILSEVKKNNQEALCIYGANSKYVTNNNLVSFEKYFTNISFVKVDDAGHLLHVENPDAFYLALINFLHN